MATMNRLISELPADLRLRLKSHLHRVSLRRDTILFTPEQQVDHIDFIEAGIVSLTWPSPPRAIDVALVGCEGLLGHGVLLGGATAMLGAVARTDLIVLRMAAANFREFMRDSVEFNGQVFRFARSVTLQMSECAYSNARATVEQRLARWILLAAERLSSTTITMTHDGLAAAIGCRRAGVTVSLHILEGEHIIKARRSRITILDLDRLRQVSALPAGEEEHAEFACGRIASPVQRSSPSGH